TGHAPLIADVLIGYGQAQVIGGDVDAGIALLYEGARVAGEARSDELIADALLKLVFAVGNRKHRAHESLGLMRLAEGAVARAGSALPAWAELMLVEGEVFVADGNQHAALPRLIMALAMEQKLYGERNWLIGSTLSNVAQSEGRLGMSRAAR